MCTPWSIYGIRVDLYLCICVVLDQVVALGI